MAEDQERPEGLHELDEPLQSSLSNIKSFKDDVVWGDIKQWLRSRIEILHTKLENAQSLDEVRGFQYAIKNCKDVLELPSRFEDELKYQQRG